MKQETLKLIEETNSYYNAGASGASYAQRHFINGAIEALNNEEVLASEGLSRNEWVRFDEKPCDYFPCFGWCETEISPFIRCISSQNDHGLVYTHWCKQMNPPQTDLSKLFQD